jgi:hypothetical protein
MGFLKKLFGSTKVDGAALAASEDMRDYAQVELLAEFSVSRMRHNAQEQQRWNRVLPRSYEETLAFFQKEGWLEESSATLQVANAALPYIEAYRSRLEAEKAAVMPRVRAALQQRDTGEALQIRRDYEARQPLGTASWTGPEPQLSHSALTRRILFLDHWLLDGLSDETVVWLKAYAAEQHLWGAYWHLDAAQVPGCVQQELTGGGESVPEAAYWKAYQLALYVDNQETYQRCKGGDHVRRIEIAGPNDSFTCEQCQEFIGKQYLVARVPELPHRNCTSPRGCRCHYEPVLDTYTN